MWLQQWNHCLQGQLSPKSMSTQLLVVILAQCVLNENSFPQSAAWTRVLNFYMNIVYLSSSYK